MRVAATGPLEGVTLARWLAEATRAGAERLDAQHLLAHTLARSRSWLLAHDDAVLSPPQQAHLDARLAQLVAGEPLGHVIGEQEFHGLTLRVTPDVLVPRSDTEVLVDWAIELLRGALAGRAAPAVVDLGTGSGAIALAIKNACARAAVLATDNSPAALEVARGNAERLGLDVAFALGSWWEAAGGAAPGPGFDLAVSNPPYIAAGDPHLPALRHEPMAALSPGGNGMAAFEAIVAAAPAHLAPGGWLLLEHGFDQAEAVSGLLRAQGFQNIETREDLGSRARCTGGRFAPIATHPRADGVP